MLFSGLFVFIEIMKYYKITNKDIWQGRVDDPVDRDSFRWHQVVEPVDLSDPNLRVPEKGKTGFCFLGFCSDEGVVRNLGRPGTVKAPDSIRKEMANLPCYFGKDTVLYDAGNIYCGEDLEEGLEVLSVCIELILSANLFPVVLGGGHEIAFGHYNGLLKHLPDNIKTGIINLDAHFDLRPYDKGISSGCMFLKLADQCKNSQRDFCYYCLGIQRYSNTPSLFRKADSIGAGYIPATDIKDSDISKVFAGINNFISGKDHIYLTICADVFSSAYAPGVSAPQPFGLHPEIVLKLIKHIISSGKVISCDIAEVSPRFDEDNRTSKLAAVTIFAIINTATGNL